MKHERFAPKSAPYKEYNPLITVEDAWFWFYHCQILRQEGARFDSSDDFVRSCDPDGIHRAVMRLLRQRRIERFHLLVLGRYRLCLIQIRSIFE